MMNVAVCIPALNAGETWDEFSSSLKHQSFLSQTVLVVDSESDDDTAERARADDYRVISIARNDFGHGATRQYAASLVSDADILVYLTQDAVLAGANAIENLVASFEDPSVGAAYGRQLPRRGAGPIETHARLFNYPQTSALRSLEDRNTLGFKAIFISNSFAAYRRTALDAVGGFPLDTIFGEDTVVAARMLSAGWNIAYVSEAQVFHSHPYNLTQEFRRYFDIGVLHSREPVLLKEFGKASGEGKRFVFSELRYLWQKNKILIPSAMLRTLAKFSAYRLGRAEAKLSTKTKRKLSMHRAYWKNSD